MPANGFSIGQDISVDVYDVRTSAILRFPARTQYKGDPITQQIKSEPLNGPPLFAEVPNGHKITLEFDRTDSTIDDYFATNEDYYFSGGNLQPWTINETIREKDGSISQYRYEGAIPKLTSRGMWKSTDKVTQSVECTASRKRKVL